MIGPDGEEYVQMRLSDDPAFETFRLGPDEEIARIETTLSEIQAPAVSVSIHFDVNDWLSSRDESEMWDLLGRLKDFFGPTPQRP